jgi:hypothetical protein
MLIIPRNSLKFRLLVDSNPTFARSNIEPWLSRLSFGLNRSHQQGAERREFHEPR